ncbi:MAG: 4-(cytidine 5'-diphospho)-2-C-methyl-D-erythritol kinase [Flavobacteriales bacterium]|nr:4-(cytidine 5'-diphospho)-2-C-methyl-D-erythritol kinase [Flavobacteriales bacterium]|tara:strand:- start:11682 stop:12563 length:882 start_codon:yes stop_codon:yes gene_type:complete
MLQIYILLKNINKLIHLLIISLLLMLSYSNAKINLGLKIISKRLDGFHNLSSIFLPIPLYDLIEIQIPRNSINKNQITYSGLIKGHIENDLVLKAYDVLSNDYDLPYLNIHLHKNIPLGAGLGGGSSNASFMLMMLNNLFNLKLSLKKLSNYAVKLGSDCPFFIYNNLSYVSGLGDIVKPIDYSCNGFYIVIIKPKYHCSTSKVFDLLSIDKLNKKELEFNDDICCWKNDLVNDLESVVFALYPELKQIKKYLYSKGSFYTSMSGSGSAVYGLFDHKPDIDSKFNYWCWISKI